MTIDESNEVKGFSFPTTGGRLLLGPEPSEIAGMGGGAPNPGEPGGGGSGSEIEGDLNSRPGDEGRPDINDPGSSVAGSGGGAAGTGATAPPPADPNQAAGAGTAPDGWQSIRDAARGLGYNFEPSIQDDRTALLHLIRQASQAQQANYYADLGRQIVPHAQQFQSYLQQQQQPQTQERPAWEAPPFDERWLALVTQDQATGLYVSKPGVDPAVARQVNEFAEWKSNFDRNPAATLNTMVESRAREIAREESRRAAQEWQQQNAIAQITESNSRWLYQHDEQGRRVVGHNGSFVPTPEGARYIDHLRSLAQAGIKDPRTQDAIARQLLAGEIALARGQQAQAGQLQAASPQTQQAIARPNLNVLQAQPPTQRRRNPAATEPTTAGLSLREMLAAEMAAEGVTDQDIFQSVGQ